MPWHFSEPVHSELAAAAACGHGHERRAAAAAAVARRQHRPSFPPLVLELLLGRRRERRKSAEHRRGPIRVPFQVLFPELGDVARFEAKALEAAWAEDRRGRGVLHGLDLDEEPHDGLWRVSVLVVPEGQQVGKGVVGRS